MKIITGGVTAAKGFQAASTAAGIKYQGRTDMAMVYSEKPCVAAGTFTTNIVKAAPVKWDQEIVYQHPSAQVTHPVAVVLPMHVPVKRDLVTAGPLQKQQRKL